MTKEEALDILRGLHDKAIFSERTALEALVPELRESEDERMKRTLIGHLTRLSHGETTLMTKATYEQWIAWLERLDIRETPREEPEPEPHFDVDDWVIYNGYAYRIINLDDHEYTLQANTDGILQQAVVLFTEEAKIRLWNINDAKPGDVLISGAGHPFIYNGHFNPYTREVGALCGIDTSLHFTIACTPSSWTSVIGIQPAPKYDRNILFNAMAKAGYKWDTDKLELRTTDEK